MSDRLESEDGGDTKSLTSELCAYDDLNVAVNMFYEILLEFGHTAVIKEKPVVFKDGVAHTHDWHLLVKAFDGGNCENYLEKVVFRLHNSYKRNKRMVKTPPFVTRDSAYGTSFTVPIDLYFKTTDTRFQKKRVNYDVVLQPNKDTMFPTDPDCEHKFKMSRTEKFTFPGSVDEGFRNRLLLGGGKLVHLALPLGGISSSTSYEESNSKSASSTDRTINKDAEKENLKRRKHKHKKKKKHRSIEEKEVKHPEEGSGEDVKPSAIMDQVVLEIEADIKEDSENGRIASRKSIYVEIKNEENKRPKLETYCLLCQEYGHVLNDDCVVNATCLSCGVKGHVRRDCYCLLCQEYGHVLNEDCTTCFNCGLKGHVRRDCSLVHHFREGSPMNNNRKRPCPSFESSPSAKRWCRDAS